MAYTTSTCILSFSPVSMSSTSANLASRSSTPSSSAAQVSSCLPSSPIISHSTIQFVCPKIRNQCNLLLYQSRFPCHMSMEDIFNGKLGNGMKSDCFKLSCMRKIRLPCFQAFRWKITTQSVPYHDITRKKTSCFILEAVPNYLVYNMRDSSNKISCQASGSNEEVDQYVSHEEKRSTSTSRSLLFNVGDDGTLIRKVALAADADSVLAIIANKGSENPQDLVLTLDDCCILLQAALAEDNAELAFSILNAMQRRAGSLTGYQWPQPDVRTYITLIKGLTASLRVTDALGVVKDVKRRGIPAGEEGQSYSNGYKEVGSYVLKFGLLTSRWNLNVCVEGNILKWIHPFLEVPFGKVVNCPTCDIALAVVQPQHGLQLVPCSKCRYQYELMSGDVVGCESESISMNISAFQRALSALQLKKQPLPSAVHSLVIKSPDGMARTYRFATASADVPAQPGERITVASAAPENSARGVGPFKVSARVPEWRPSEPMLITNHFTGSIYPLLHAPPKSGSGAELDTRILGPAIFILASSDAATALIDPSLPRTLAVTAVAAAVFGTAANNWILPILNQLPQRTADAVAFRQELLAQYEVLQARLQDLTQGAAEEVRILARLCQLQNKMEAVQEPTYSARLDRIRRAREGLDERLTSRLELIDSYAKVSSMIEIEVEMDINVLAAEEGAAMATIAAQIEQLEEAENLQKKWVMQAEVNDEVERLMQSTPGLTDAA